MSSSLRWVHIFLFSCLAFFAFFPGFVFSVFFFFFFFLRWIRKNNDTVNVKSSTRFHCHSTYSYRVSIQTTIACACNKQNQQQLLLLLLVLPRGARALLTRPDPLFLFLTAGTDTGGTPSFTTSSSKWKKGTSRTSIYPTRCAKATQSKKSSK